MALNITYAAPSVVPIGSKLTITENGQYDVTDYAVADVNISGGGGSSDFSTAKVTITNIAENNPYIFMPLAIYYDNGDEYYTFPELDHEGNTPITVNAILYKGFQLLPSWIDNITAVSGDIELRAEGYVITGDCTITVNMED